MGYSDTEKWLDDPPGNWDKAPEHPPAKGQDLELEELEGGGGVLYGDGNEAQLYSDKTVRLEEWK